MNYNCTEQLYGWPATAYETAVEAIGCGLELSLTDDGHLRVRGPRAAIDQLRPQLERWRDQIVAQLAGDSVPDPVRGGMALRDARRCRRGSRGRGEQESDFDSEAVRQTVFDIA